MTDDPQSFIEERTLAGIREAKEGFQHRRQMGRLEKYHGDKAQWVLDSWTETWLSPAFASWSLREILPRVTAPLLAIHGALDEYGSPQQPALISSLASGKSRMEVLDGVHHVPHREVEARVVKLACDFLDSVTGR